MFSYNKIKEKKSNRHGAHYFSCTITCNIQLVPVLYSKVYHYKLSSGKT